MSKNQAAPALLDQFALLSDREILVGVYELLAALTRKLTGEVPAHHVASKNDNHCYLAPNNGAVKFISAQTYDRELSRVSTDPQPGTRCPAAISGEDRAAGRVPSDRL